jgi:formylglycine-generating enzyme
MRAAALVVMAGAAAFAQRLEFVRIPAGSFPMGCEAAEPCAKSLPMKRVAVAAFEMAKYEVTVGQFRAFVRATGYRTDAEKAGEARTWRS